MKRWVVALITGISVGLAAVAAGEEPADEVFQVALLTVKNDWQAIRYHRHSGQSWYAVGGDWKPVPESGESKAPAGLYKVLMTATGENDWFAMRLEQKSGRSWRLAALKWVEMKVLEDEKPAGPMVGAEAE